MQIRKWNARAILVAAALAVVAPSVWAQTTTWNGTVDNLWTNSSNWDAGVPSSGSISLFNNAGNGNTTITLSGASQPVGTILFDTSSVAAYMLGDGSAGDNFSLSSAGEIAVNTGVTTNQTIGAAITMNGSGTMINSSTGSSLILGSSASPGTITLASGGTLSVNDNAAAGSSIVINDVIADPNSGNGIVAYSGKNLGLIQINSLNTYAGPTYLNGNQVVVQFNHDYNVGDPSGPFGTGTITANNSTNNFLQPVGGTRTLANPISMLTGFTVTNASGDTTSGLTLTGPITLTSTSGRALADNLAATAILTLGDSASPSTITLSNGTNAALTFSGAGGLVINDVIKDGTNPGLVIYGSTGAVRINSHNVNTGTVSLTGQGGNFLLNTSSDATSGPFGVGTLVSSNGTLPPILIPIGTDRTIANPVIFSSGMFAATASAANDGTGPHNLTFTGTLNMASGKAITNNILSGGSLIFGTAGSPSTLTISAGVMQMQTNIPGNGKSIVINDFVTGNGGITVKNNQTAYLNNANSYVGPTTVTGDSDSLGYGSLYVNNASGSGTGSSTVTVRGNNTGVGKGGTLGGNGSISGAVAISPVGQEGGNLSPGTSGLGTRGTLTVGSMTWNPVGRYVFEYNASDTTQGGGVNDLVSSAGALDLSSLTANSFDLNLNPYAGAPSGTPVTYVIANFAGGITKPGAIVTNDVSSLFTFSGLFGSTPTVMIDSGNPNLLDLTFAPVPEPTTILLGALGTIGLGLRPKRRRRRA